MKKKVFGAFLILTVAGVFLLTLQSPEVTTRLSESVRLWLAAHGVEISPHQLRSDVHILEYLAVGILLAAFGKASGWKERTILLVGFGIGLLDEGLKYYLPTREFDVVDLLKDWIGILLAAYVVSRLRRETDVG